MQFTIGTQNLLPFNLLRTTIAVLMAIHGIARIAFDEINELGVFLELHGLPFGLFLSWVITLTELIGAGMLLFNFLVRYACAWFVLQLVLGIVIHYREGWFVVGPGQNGIEYSVLLIVCFIAVGWIDLLLKKGSSSA